MAPAVAADMELDSGADPSTAPEEEPDAGKGEEGQPLLEGAAGIEVPAHVGKHEAKASGDFTKILVIPAQKT